MVPIMISCSSYTWVAILKIHAVATIALHGITLYCCVTMAVIRWGALNKAASRWLRPSTSWLVPLFVVFQPKRNYL